MTMMRQDLVDERECGGQFHVAVTLTLDLLAKQRKWWWFRVEEGKGEKEREGDSILRVEFAMW